MLGRSSYDSETFRSQLASGPSCTTPPSIVYVCLSDGSRVVCVGSRVVCVRSGVVCETSDTWCRSVYVPGSGVCVVACVVCVWSGTRSVYGPRRDSDPTLSLTLDVESEDLFGVQVVV